MIPDEIRWDERNHAFACIPMVRGIRRERGSIQRIFLTGFSKNLQVRAGVRNSTSGRRNVIILHSPIAACFYTVLSL